MQSKNQPADEGGEVETEEDKAAAATTKKTAYKIQKARNNIKESPSDDFVKTGLDFEKTCKKFGDTMPKWNHLFTKTWLLQDCGIKEEGLVA